MKRPTTRTMISAGFAALILLACAEAAEKPRHEHSLRLEEHVDLDDARLSLTFERVTRDNRCPKGVQCIVGGEAVVVFSASTKDAAAELTFEVGARAKPTQSFDGYTIEVTAVEPYPVAGRSIAPEDYVATFVVDKP